MWINTSPCLSVSQIKKLKWPKSVWPLLLQCVFTGRAQDAYASLAPESSVDYEKIKAAVLRAYELVPVFCCLFS